MSTDYNKWNKWDESVAEVDTERRWEVDALEDETLRTAHQLREATAAVHESTLRSAEALKAKAAVERLKAMTGGPGGRARRRAAETCPSAAEEAPAVEEQTTIGRLAETLGGISTALADALARLNGLKTDAKSHNAAETSLAAGMDTLRGLSELGAQCIQLRRERVWRLEEASACRPLMADLERSIVSLYGEATFMISVLGLNLGEYGVAVDMSRCMLKIAQAAAPSQSKTDHGHAHDHDTAHKKNEKPHRHTEAVVFVVRGLAFLCMGHAYLCHLHLTQALHLHPKYPGLAGLTERVDKQVTTEAMMATARTAAMLPFIVVDLRRALKRITSRADTIAPTRLESVDVFAILNGGASSSEAGALTSEPVSSLLHMDEVYSQAENRLKLDPSSAVCAGSGCDVTELILNDVRSRRVSPAILLVLLRRLFFEGQVLYLESVMRSAEIKYMSALAVSRAWLFMQEHLSDGGFADVVAIVCASLINAAACRSGRLIKFPKASNSWSPLHTASDQVDNFGIRVFHSLPSISELCELHPLSLFDIASNAMAECSQAIPGGIRPYSAVVLDMRRALLLEREGRLAEAADCLESVRSKLCDEEAISKSLTYELTQKNGVGLFVSQYPRGQLLSQSFLSGKVCAPVDYSNASYKDDSVSVREIVHPDLCSIPTDNVLKTQIADVDVKLAKLRMQLSSLVITDK